MPPEQRTMKSRFCRLPLYFSSSFLFSIQINASASCPATKCSIRRSSSTRKRYLDDVLMYIATTVASHYYIIIMIYIIIIFIGISILFSSNNFSLPVDSHIPLIAVVAKPRKPRAVCNQLYICSSHYI